MDCSEKRVIGCKICVCVGVGVCERGEAFPSGYCDYGPCCVGNLGIVIDDDSEEHNWGPSKNGSCLFFVFL